MMTIIIIIIKTAILTDIEVISLTTGEGERTKVF